MTSTAAPHSMGSPSGRLAGDRRVLLVAFVVSVLLHLAGVLVAQRVPVNLSESGRAPSEQTVEIALEPDRSAAAEAAAEAEAEAERKERERIFTSIPERLASQTPPQDDPDQPQYLAMYHALAANPTVGGDALRPSAPQPAESEAVAVRREELEGAAGVSVTAGAAAEPRQPTTAREAAEQAQAVARQERAELAQERKRSRPLDSAEQGVLPVPQADEVEPARRREEARTAAPAPLEPWWSPTAPSILRQGAQGAAGDRGIDFDQEARGLQTSGVARVGDFSLNTWEWNYAPWMQAFGNALMRNWVPPPARQMGLISGKTVLRVVVEKNGLVSVAEIVETEGHQSLHDASRSALLSSSPFAPLPSHFPLAHLEIRLTMFYPEPPR